MAVLVRLRDDFARVLVDVGLEGASTPLIDNLFLLQKLELLGLLDLPAVALLDEVLELSLWLVGPACLRPERGVEALWILLDGFLDNDCRSLALLKLALA